MTSALRNIDAGLLYPHSGSGSLHIFPHTDAFLLQRRRVCGDLPMGKMVKEYHDPKSQTDGIGDFQNRKSVGAGSGHQKVDLVKGIGDTDVIVKRS